MADCEIMEKMTNEQIRKEMMAHIEYLKIIDLCNKAGMHGKEENQVRKESKERIQSCMTCFWKWRSKRYAGNFALMQFLTVTILEKIKIADMVGQLS